jgi:hypothetical protein
MSTDDALDIFVNWRNYRCSGEPASIEAGRIAQLSYPLGQDAKFSS